MPSQEMIDQQRREFGIVVSNPVRFASGVLLADLNQGSVQQFTLNGNVFVGQPTNAPNLGDRFTLILVQDATGSRSVTWGICFRDAPAWSPGAANTRATATFVFDGLTYQYVGGSSAFAVSGLSVVPNAGAALLNADAPNPLTNPAPTAASLTLAGVAPGVTKPTVTAIAPTVGALAATGIAPVVSTLLTPATGTLTVFSLPPTRSP